MTTPESTARPELYRRIVIAIGPDRGLAALHLAKLLAAPDAVFVLVHICTVAPVAGILPLAASPRFARTDALALLHAARRGFPHPCELVVEDALDVAQGVHRVADREQADLLVVGAARPGHRGHVAVKDLLHHAPCAVAVAPTAAATEQFSLDRVGIAYRPTAPGRHAAELARTVAEHAGSELHAMTVVPVAPNPWAGAVIGSAQLIARLDGTLAKEAHASLRELGDVVDHVAEGDPVQELRRFASTLDLLVVGSRCGGPLRRMATGSTADALGDRCDSALLVAGCHDEPLSAHQG